VFYTLFVDFLVCYGSHHLLAFLYISAPFYCFHCVSCHFFSVIIFSFQFPPFKLCSMSCSCFLLHVSSIFHRLQSFSAFAWVKSCQTPLQNAMKLHAMRVVVWVSFPHYFNAISLIGLCLRVSKDVHLHLCLIIDHTQAPNRIDLSIEHLPLSLRFCFCFHPFFPLHTFCLRSVTSDSVHQILTWLLLRKAKS